MANNEYIHKLKSNADEELRKIAEKGLNSNNLDNAYKLTMMKEKLCRTEQIEEEQQDNYSGRRYRYSNDGYSNGYSNDGYSNDGYSNDGYSGARRGQHYVRGHYSHDGNYSNDGYSGNYSNGNHGYSNNGYSGKGRMENCKMEMMDALDMMERTANDQDKRKIREYRKTIESMEV